MMNIGLINCSPKKSGVGRYTFTLYDKFRSRDNINLVNIDYSSKKINIHHSLANIPLKKRPIDYKYFCIDRNKKRIPKFSLYHLTTQNLSFLDLSPKIVTCHDIIGLVRPDNIISHFLTKYLYKGLLNAERVIAVSKKTKQDLVEHLKISGKKIKVIYSGIDLEIFRQKNQEGLVSIREKFNLSQNNDYIFHISAEQPNKNMEGVIKSFYQLKRNYKDRGIKLIKAGLPQNKKYRKKITQLIEKLGLAENVQFLGKVSEEELVGLYNIAKVFILPSFYEGFGFPVLEAIACGCPVVASNTPSLLEVVGNTGITVDPFDIDGLGRAMYEILTNDKLKEEMIREGLKQAKKFSWESTANETLKIYKEFE